MVHGFVGWLVQVPLPVLDDTNHDAIHVSDHVSTPHSCSS